MLEAEYIRDMHNNYMIITDQNENKSDYKIKMLLENSIQGVLKTELRCFNQTDLFYYDITSLKTIAAAYEHISLSFDDINQLLNQILNIIERCGEYLLSEDDFIIDPKYMYIDVTTQSISLCYLIGYGENLQKQLVRFMEYLMNKVNYKDEQAVLLIYSMYKESREEGCTFQRLLMELNNRSNNKPDTNTTNSNRKVKSELTKEEKILSTSTLHETRNGNISTQMTSAQESNVKKKDKNLKSKFKKADNDRTVNNQKVNNRTDNYKSNKKGSNFNIIFNKNSKKAKVKESKNTSPQKDMIYNRILEEIENEEEMSYFSWKTYFLAGMSALAGAIVICLALILKLVYNTFGTHIDPVKFLGCFTITSLVEIYVMIRLFDKKNQVTKMVASIEYIKESKETEKQKDHKQFFDEDINLNNQRSAKNINEIEVKSNKETNNETNNETDGESDNLIDTETTLLWYGEEDPELEQTVVLSKLLPSFQYYLEVDNDNKRSDDSNQTDSVYSITKNISNNRTSFTANSTKTLVNEFPFIIGKSVKGSNLTINNKSISRIHAELIKRKEGIYLSDLGSTNGTYINGIRLEANKPYELSDQDRVTFSNVKYRWIVKEI